MSQTRTFDPAGVLFGVTIPVLAAAAGLVLTRMWQERLPASIATHWSGENPDGFTTLWSAAWTFAIVIVLIGGGAAAIAAIAGALLMMRRTMLIVGLTVVGLMFAIWVALLRAHLDLAAAEGARLPTAAIGVGVLAGAAVGLLGGSLLRDYRPRTATTDRPDPSLPRGPLDLPIVDRRGLGAGTTAVLIAVGAAITLGLCRLAGSWWLLAIFLPVCVLIVGLLRFRVTVDENGIRIYNMGMCALDYRVDEIVGAKVDEVNPFKDFGGWGLRIKGRGNYGLVTDTGPALMLTAANGQRLTVSTDRAEQMAGALNALADASR
ncbi:DUF1648 domain-containing protein [Rhodococcus sp. NPDC127528]|uniref:DUF1648 domain-containing protein n=1 Tax=unclassified Rhodococcus (in: high G+C Gram-positive bacteria) TaxID=192944 RepID=UPI0036456BF4